MGSHYVAFLLGIWYITQVSILAVLKTIVQIGGFVVELVDEIRTEKRREQEKLAKARKKMADTANKAAHGPFTPPAPVNKMPDLRIVPGINTIPDKK